MVYTLRLQSAVVVENACIDATMSIAASAWRGRTTSRLASQRALRVASFASGQCELQHGPTGEKLRSHAIISNRLSEKELC
jgi:hypothetical protein